MLIAVLLILSLVLLAVFIYLELMEMAVGALASAVVLASVGFAFKLAAVMTIVSIIGIALLIGLSYAAWRMFGGGSSGNKGPSIG